MVKKTVDSKVSTTKDVKWVDIYLVDSVVLEKRSGLNLNMMVAFTLIIVLLEL